MVSIPEPFSVSRRQWSGLSHVDTSKGNAESTHLHSTDWQELAAKQNPDANTTNGEPEPEAETTNSHYIIYVGCFYKVSTLSFLICEMGRITISIQVLLWGFGETMCVKALWWSHGGSVEGSPLTLSRIKLWFIEKNAKNTCSEKKKNQQTKTKWKQNRSYQLGMLSEPNFPAS